MRPSPLPLLLLLCACLERTTGEPKALDARFFAAAPGGGSAGGGDPALVPHGEGAAHGEVAHGEVTHGEVEHHEDARPAGPFDELEGPRVTLRGVIEGPPGEVQLDFRAPDPEAEGGVRQLGKLFLDEVGAFELEVPLSFGALSVEAFQDPDGDGPSDGDPFGAMELVVGEVDLEGLTLTLEAGGRLKHIAAQGGAEMNPFKDHEGAWTLISGVIIGDDEGLVALDLRGPDPDSQTGDRYIGKVQLPGPGAYSFRAPRGIGELVVEAFQDAGGDGPDARDPYARVRVAVGEVEAVSQDFTLVVGAWTAAPVGSAPDAPPGGGLGQGAQPLFDALGESPVTVSGVIVLGEGVEAATLDLDIFSTDPSAPGGRRFLGKLKVPPGAFSFQAPRGAGSLALEAFIDVGGDGPTPGDPFGAPTSTVVVRQSDVVGVQILVSSG